MKSILTVLMVISFLGCKPMWIQTKQYSGDGVIRRCSTLLSSGYAIKFPEFDSAHAYSTSYRLSRVPQVSNFDRQRDPRLYLRLQWNRLFSEWREVQKSLTGKIQLALEDSGGRIINANEVLLSEMTLTQTERGYAIYDLAKTRLHFEPDKSYVLHVTYIPGAVPLPANPLYFEIHDCAYY